MRKFIVFPDGYKRELSPMTFDEFDKWGHWGNNNDMAFERFLGENNYTELDRLRGFHDRYSDEYRQAKIVLEDGEPVFDREKIYGLDEED